MKQLLLLFLFVVLKTFANGQSSGSSLAGTWTIASIVKFDPSDSTWGTSEIDTANVEIVFGEDGSFITRQLKGNGMSVLGQGHYSLSADKKTFTQDDRQYDVLRLEPGILEIRLEEDYILKMEKAGIAKQPLEKLSGRVVDADNHPIPAVSVGTLGKPAIQTDNEGMFRMPLAENENDSIRFSSIGYHDLAMSVAEFNKTRIAHLSLKVAQLDDVMINARKSMVTLNDFRGCTSSYYGSSGTIKLVAQPFHSSYQPFRLHDLRICIDAGRRCSFRLRVFEADSTTGRPGEEITDKELLVRPRGKGRTKVVLDTFNIVIHTKDFLVGVEWLLIPENETYSKWKGQRSLSYEPWIGMSKEKVGMVSTGTSSPIWQLAYDGRWIPYHRDTSLLMALSIMPLEQ